MRHPNKVMEYSEVHEGRTISQSTYGELVNSQLSDDLCLCELERPRLKSVACTATHPLSPSVIVISF